MARSDDPFNAAWVAMPARTLWPAMLVAFIPALAAAVLKIAAIESRCSAIGGYIAVTVDRAKNSALGIP